jgi:MFS transporter, putative metabolite:H+ symporter
MTPAPSGAPSAPLPPLTGYQKRLFAFLGVATFFEGYDFFALTMVLPHLRKTFALGYADTGLLLGVVNFGTVLAYLLVGKADRWGRRRVLSVTILGYTLFTVLSGLAPNVWIFAIMQMVARIFLIGEWATSMVMAAEEFPAERRGMVIGVVSATAGLGSVICAVVVPPLTHAFGWRSVYFAGVVPLLLLAWARRGLRETERFAARPPEERSRSIFDILRGPYRRRVLELGAIWFLTYVCTQNVVSLWKDYALGDLGFAEGKATLIITLGAGASMPLVFFAGKLFDVIGRRMGAVVVYATLIAGVLGGYTLTGIPVLAVSMIAAVFGLNSVLTLLNTFTAELFPTAMRGDAFLWSNNLIGRIGYVASPVIAGQLAKDGGWGPVMRVSVVFPAAALLLLLWLLPETSRRELEQTSDLGAPS